MTISTLGCLSLLLAMAAQWAREVPSPRVPRAVPPVLGVLGLALILWGTH